MPHPESLFHKRVNRRLPKEVRAEKMHNIYRGGTPDFWYSGYKDDYWIEYKWVSELPVRVPVKPDLSALQLLWINDAFDKGRNVCVIIGSPTGCTILLNGAWNNPVNTSSFTLTEQEIVNWIIGQVHAPAIKPISTSNGNDL